MSLYSDLNEVLTPYAQRIKGLKADLTLVDTNLDNLANGEPPETPIFVTGWSHGNVTTSNITSVTYRAYSSRMTPVLNQLFYFDDTKYRLTFAAYRNASDENARTVRSWQTESPATQPFDPNTDAKMVVMLDDKAGSSAVIDLNSINVYTVETTQAPIVERISELETEIGYQKTLIAPTLSSGKYINYWTLRVGMNWTDSLTDGSGVYLPTPIDLSAYIGLELFISADTISTSSTRAFGICDSDGVVFSRFAERYMTYDEETEKYCTQITIDGSHLYFSASTSMTGLEISVVKQNYTTQNDVKKIIRNNAVYVASDGDDTAMGSQGDPFATIQHAIDTGAEIIKVFAGTYAPFVVEDRTFPLRIELAEMPSYEASTPYVPKIVIQDSNSNNAITINRCADVYIADVEGTGVKQHIFNINDVNRLEMVRCIAHEPLTASRSGFKLVNVNGVFYDCIAHDVTLDGFNIHGYGNTEFINCLAYNNDDDGISHHDGCTGYVLGGEFYNNGKSGIATPTYGARININGAYTHDNLQYGFYILGGQSNPSPVIARVSNCLAKNNASFDFLINNADVVGWGNAYDTKQVDDNATFTEY